MEPLVYDFYQSLREGRIVGRKCRECGFVSLPPRAICPVCGSAEGSWSEISGKGTLLFASVGRHLMLGIDFILGTVKLDEGCLIPGQVLVDDFDFSDPGRIWEYNGGHLSVKAEVISTPRDVPAIAFRIVGN